MANKVRDLSGLEVGRLTVLYPTNKRSKNGTVYWACRCSCGTKITVVSTSLTRPGATLSCGCLKVEVSIEVNTKHGHAKREHAQETPEYRAWHGMWSRCRNLRDKNYGGKGIAVCTRWKVFENFLKDMGLKPGKEYQLDRIDNLKGYSPKNCRWATRRQNMNNRTCTRFLTYRGETKALSYWAEEFGIPLNALYRRIKAGQSAQQVLFG